MTRFTYRGAFSALGGIWLQHGAFGYSGHNFEVILLIRAVFFRNVAFLYIADVSSKSIHAFFVEQLEFYIYHGDIITNTLIDLQRF